MMNNPISLEQAMSELRSKYIEAKASTKKIIDSLFCEIKEYGQSFIGEQGELLVSYYENKYKVPAFTRPKEKKLEQRAGLVIKLYLMMQGEEYAKHINFYNIYSIPWWEEVLTEFKVWLKSKNCSDVSVDTRIKHVRAFLRHVESTGKNSMESLVMKDFSSFIAEMDLKGFRYSSRSSIISSLRVFVESPICIERLNVAPMILLKGIRNPKHDVLPSVFSPEEVSKLLSAVDRGTARGKLQYAVMLLASIYGIRNVDIANLKLDDIKWSENRISFIQHKTLKAVSLPFMDEVRYALLDYISSCRPECEYTNVFITARAPHTPYKTFSNIVNEALESAGIDAKGRHHGLHSLRHSLATLLHSKETPINQIADILGHSTSQSTMTYIWSDIERLRKVAGEVPLC